MYLFLKYNLRAINYCIDGLQKPPNSWVPPNKLTPDDSEHQDAEDDDDTHSDDEDSLISLSDGDSDDNE